MERNRVILTDRERQQQQQERERQEQCNAEQAVTKHFEESLRRAKEKVSRITHICRRFFRVYIQMFLC